MIILVKRNWVILAIIFLSFWAIKPLFVSGFFPMHDDTQVARVFEMGIMLKDGIFPVRWVPDLGYGYGYPIFNFYAPLAYYVGGLFILLGFDALIATKIMMVIGILLAGIFMYLLAREFWGKLGGVLSGLFYVYAPYHALDIYVRGDVAEFWAYAFVPLMFWGFYKVFKEGAWKWVIVGSIGYAGIILSHNLTAMMVTPFLAIVILLHCYIAYKKKRILNTYYLILTTILGLMLSAFYWLPALLEMKYTNVLSQIGGGADFRDHFVCLAQLWDSHWGFGGSALGCIDGLSFKIGKLHILMVFISLFLTIKANKFFYIFRHSGDSERSVEDSRIPTELRDSGQARMTGLVLLSVLGLLISIFLMLEISKPIWEAIPAMAFLQYPWRFLILASFFSSFLSGAIFMLLNKESFKKYRFYIAIILAVLLISFNIKLFNPQTMSQKISTDYTNEYALKWTASKISDEFLPPNFKKPESDEEIAKGLAIAPEETLTQKISNIISFGGIVILSVGIIVFRKKGLSR